MRRVVSLAVVLGLAFPVASVGCVDSRSGSALSAPASDASWLRVRFLGVGGFMIESGGESVLTAPLYTRPSLLEVGAGAVASDPATVERHLPTPALAQVRAILSGHAHYDHLLDVPSVLARAPQATLYANRSARNILAAHAPERPARCQGTPPAWPAVPRARVVALDEPTRSFVDYTFCPRRRPAGAPVMGTWVSVPGSHVRILALCSEHPEQLGPVHYAPGAVDEELCALPRRADGWREGMTLSYLVDFMDPSMRAPLYRVFYQDAPTNAPVGHVPQQVLADKRVDLALLCIGAYGEVSGAPSFTLGDLRPRYALGGHWEDFFRPAAAPPVPIPLLDVGGWASRARAALPPAPDRPLMVDGVAGQGRAFVPMPGDLFELGPQ